MIQEGMMKFLRLTHPSLKGKTRADIADSGSVLMNYRQFQAIVDHIDQGIIAVDEQGNILFINAAAGHIFDLDPAGYSPTDVDGLARLCELRDESGDLVHPDQWPHREIFEKERFPARNLKITHKTHFRSRIARVTGMPIKDRDGRPLLAILTIRDITRDIRVTEMLRSTRNRLAAILSSIQEGFIVLDGDWRFTYVNSLAAQLLDSTPNDLNGQVIWEVFPQLSKSIFHQRFLDASEKQELTRFEEYYPPADSWLECRCYPIPGGLTVLFTDHTEQRRLKEMLQNHKNRLSDVLEGSNDGYWDWDLTAGRVQVSPRSLEILGLKQDELIVDDRMLLELIHPEDAVGLKKEIVRAVKTKEGEDRYEVEHRVRHQDGTYIWIFNRGKVTRRDEQGRALRLSGTITDVTDRVYEKELLALSEELARGRLAEIEAIYQTAPVGLCVLDERLRYVRINDRLADINGIESNEHIGKTIREVMPETANEVEPHCLKVIESGTPVLNVEISGRTPREPGMLCHWMEHFYPLQGPEGTIVGVNVVVEEITERKRAEAQLKSLNATLEQRVRERTRELETLNKDLQNRSQQLQALTLMLSEAEDNERRRLAEILHDDLQQLLVSARLHLGRLAAWSQADPKIGDIVNQVNDILSDSLKKTRNLSHELSPAILGRKSLSEAIGSLCRKMQNNHGLYIAVNANEEAEPSTVALKTFLIKSANELLFNIVKHAGVTKAQLRTRRTPKGVELFVADEGSGFDPEDIQAGSDKDTGIGLLSLKERINLMGGHLHIDSAPGRGSRFTVFVPDQGKTCPGAFDKTPAQASESDFIPKEAGKSGSAYSILLVDDHHMIRQGLKDILLKHCHIRTVYEAENGREALELAEKHRPDLVLMDVSMPVMNGIEATCAIKEKWPDMQVAAISMYDEPDIRAAMMKAGACAYLDKSGPVDKILAGVRKIFDPPPEGIEN